MEIGRNLIGSIGLGALAGVADARRGLEKAIGGLQMSPVMAGAASMRGQLGARNEVFTFWGPVYVSGGAAASLSKELKGRRF